MIKTEAKVTQDNHLIEACYSMNLNEKRLIMLGISKTNPQKLPKKTEPMKFSITAQEWAETYPDNENPYRDMKRAAQAIRGKFVQFRQKTGIRAVNWVDAIDYYENEARLDITFGWTMSHYLCGMAEQFTTYDLLNTQKLKSVHSIRLYELLMQFKSTGYRIESLENLRFSLNVGDGYGLWNDLNRMVIKKAVNEINAKTNIKITYQPTKTGKKTTGIKFTFREDDQKDLFRDSQD